jgi:hypothetical protein
MMLARLNRRSGLLLTLVDQALSSGTNFLLSLVALLILPTDEYALFSTVLLLSLSLAAVIRAGYVESVIIRSLGPAGWSESASSAITVGTVLGVLGLIFLVLGPDGVAPLGLIGLAALPLTLVEFGRYRAFANDAPGRACLVDGIWGAVVAVIPISAVLGARLSVAPLLVVWLLGAAVAGVVGWLDQISQLRVIQNPFRLIRGGGHLVADTALELVYLSSLVACMAWFVGEEMVATYGAVRVVFGPLTVLGLAIAPLYTARRAGSRSGNLSSDVRMLTAPLFAMCSLATVSLLVLWLSRNAIESGALGETIASGSELVMPLAVFVSSYAILQVARQYLRYSDEVRTAINLRLLVVPIWASIALPSLSGASSTASAYYLGGSGSVVMVIWVAVSVVRARAA